MSMPCRAYATALAAPPVPSTRACLCHGRNSGARVLTVMIVFYTITGLGAAILKLNNGNIGYVYYAAAIIGSVLLFVNNKIMLSYYKKHRWNN